MMGASCLCPKCCEEIVGLRERVSFLEGENVELQHSLEVYDDSELMDRFHEGRMQIIDELREQLRKANETIESVTAERDRYKGQYEIERGQTKRLHNEAQEALRTEGVVLEANALLRTTIERDAQIIGSVQFWTNTHDDVECNCVNEIKSALADHGKSEATE